MKTKARAKRAKPRKRPRRGYWAVTGLGHTTSFFRSDKDLLAYLRFNNGWIVSWIRSPQSYLEERQ